MMGRFEKEKEAFERLLGMDVALQRDLSKKAKDSFKLLYKYCVDVVRGKAKRELPVTVVVPEGKGPGDKVTVVVPMPYDVKERMLAARLLKELTWDKVVPDQRITGKEVDKKPQAEKTAAAKRLQQLQEEDRKRAAVGGGKVVAMPVRGGENG